METHVSENVKAMGGEFGGAFELTRNDFGTDFGDGSRTGGGTGAGQSTNEMTKMKSQKRGRTKEGGTAIKFSLS